MKIFFVSCSFHRTRWVYFRTSSPSCPIQSIFLFFRGCWQEESRISFLGSISTNGVPEKTTFSTFSFSSSLLLHLLLFPTIHHHETLRSSSHKWVLFFFWFYFYRVPDGLIRFFRHDIWQVRPNAPESQSPWSPPWWSAAPWWPSPAAAAAPAAMGQEESGKGFDRATEKPYLFHSFSF